ncbi:proteasome component PUP1 [Verticillium alfalfae VaMs.102]|uniref:Proteasome component PUP1 n=1 Tax=Verticillium alfalfae (strain VaMs.102 / ATCC MYA-4576 / FGSC 10136) TaxID=526221 RepID=C9SI32_VERA1|nr:proteasome component PUP1 [Verticillium alfalfae VaMs.102]EEY18605.1 proteasome component PUP1 [Verticillium alfalfae VaMs.102]
MGSGSLAAMSVFETQWKANLTRDEAVKLASDAIFAGIFNDLGSGSNVDVAIITQDKTELKRGFATTAVFNEKIIKKNEIGRYVSVTEVTSTGEAMEVDS